MNHPSIQASRPQPPACRLLSTITNNKQHIMTPDCEVFCRCAIFSSGCSRCRSISHRRHCGMAHGETCTQISEVCNHGIGISRLRHTEDPLGLHPNPCLCPVLSNNTSHVRPGRPGLATPGQQYYVRNMGYSSDGKEVPARFSTDTSTPGPLIRTSNRACKTTA